MNFVLYAVCSIWIDIYNGSWYNLDATDPVTVTIDVLDIFDGMTVTIDIPILISFLDTYALTNRFDSYDNNMDTTTSITTSSKIAGGTLIVGLFLAAIYFIMTVMDKLL